VNLLDSGQNVLGSGIGSVSYAQPDTTVLTAASIFTQGVTQYEVSEIDCFNYA
jgi:hypothetical protein